MGVDQNQIVTWTNLCEQWIKVESNRSEGRDLEIQNKIDTTPALKWAQSNCSYEDLEMKVIDLQSKYISDHLVLFTLDTLLGSYKD